MATKEVKHCDCRKKTTERLIAKIKEDNAKTTGFKILEADFDNQALVLQNDAPIKIYLPFSYKYQFTKKNGEPSVVKTKTTNIFPSYCCFCGKKLA